MAAQQFDSLTIQVQIMTAGKTGIENHSFTYENITVVKACNKAKREALAGRGAPYYGYASVTSAR